MHRPALRLPDPCGFPHASAWHGARPMRLAGVRYVLKSDQEEGLRGFKRNTHSGAQSRQSFIMKEWQLAQQFGETNGFAKPVGYCFHSVCPPPPPPRCISTLLSQGRDRSNLPPQQRALTSGSWHSRPGPSRPFCPPPPPLPHTARSPPPSPHTSEVLGGGMGDGMGGGGLCADYLPRPPPRVRPHWGMAVLFVLFSGHPFNRLRLPPNRR